MALLRQNWRDTGKKYYQLSIFEFQSSFFYPAHNHEGQAEFVYCTRGEFSHRINGVTYRHREGEMRLIRSGDIHLLRGERFSYFNLAFAEIWLDKIAGLTGFESGAVLPAGPGGLIPLSDEFRETLDTRLDRLFLWEEREEGQIPFLHFLSELMDMARTGLWEESLPGGIPDWLADALRVMEETLSLESALETSCRSREHFSRTFRRAMGMAPSVYLNSRKMEKAARLLARTNLPVKTIGDRCAFDNQNYFNRRFREYWSLTPLEYRERFRNRVH
ncbi:MAG: AraC family transcriptional regulator [Spirochaetales bacterium]|nr:AraC family transcriptional regulator [Spirochaetales bacterium]